ncbi:hypothetical protein EDB86DRAFT_2830826 [Lactarius hatsudake]|nr:hypothetical protein EDB86DRAFT_2830826 [Lactarius hatsudake]
MDKKHRLKKFFQKPVVQIVGKATSSGLVEALKQAYGIATLTREDYIGGTRWKGTDLNGPGGGLLGALAHSPGGEEFGVRVEGVDWIESRAKDRAGGVFGRVVGAEALDTLVPVPALKLALQSLLASVQAVDVVHCRNPIGISALVIWQQTAQNSDAAMGLQNRIDSFTKSVLMPIEQVDLKDMPKELVIELDRPARIFEINVTNYEDIPWVTPPVYPSR